MQAQIEKTINVNMSAQTILTKFPKQISTGMNGLSGALNVSLNSAINESDYANYFKPIFDYVRPIFLKITPYLFVSLKFNKKLVFSPIMSLSLKFQH